jgi:hypothetical protein
MSNTIALAQASAIASDNEAITSSQSGATRSGLVPEEGISAQRCCAIGSCTAPVAGVRDLRDLAGAALPAPVRTPRRPPGTSAHAAG